MTDLFLVESYKNKSYFNFSLIPCTYSNTIGSFLPVSICKGKKKKQTKFEVSFLLHYNKILSTVSCVLFDSLFYLGEIIFVVSTHHFDEK